MEAWCKIKLHIFSQQAPSDALHCLTLASGPETLFKSNDIFSDIANIVEHLPGGLSTRASTAMKRLIRNGWRGKRLVIADRLFQHHTPGDARNVRHCPNWKMNTFFVVLAVRTTAEVNKDV